MENQDLKKALRLISALGLLLVFLLVSSITLILVLRYQPELFSTESEKPETTSPELPAEGQPVEWTDEALAEVGLVEGEGLQLVLTNCTNCHSAKLVTQNRFTKEGWMQVIRWMQDTQGLWDLGSNEEPIVDYLATHFAPVARGRRAPLEVEWYTLD